MFKLALLLLGSRTVAKDWRGLLVFGAALFLGGILIIIDSSDKQTLLTLDSFGWVLVAAGSVQTILSLRTKNLHGSAANRIVGNILILAGLMITDFPYRIDVAVPVLFGVAFVTNGLFQVAASLIIRFPRWHWTLLSGIGSCAVSVLCFLNWHHAEHWVIPLFLGVVMVIWGGSSILTAFHYRALSVKTGDHDELIRELKYFFGHMVEPRFLARKPSDDNDYARLVAARSETPKGKIPAAHQTKVIEAEQAVSTQPLNVHIWTPTGTAGSPSEALNPVARYIAAVDGAGTHFTGHAAVELEPNLYISLYPREEFVLGPDGNVLADLRCKDLAGKFIPNHAFEVGDWMPPTVTIRFRRFNAPLLHGFWEFFRQDSTYNLTNRNCSVSVALALDAAFSGILKNSNSVFRLVNLFIDTDYWTAAFIRRKAEQMVWTPGLLMDYAIAMQHVLEKHS